MVAIARGTMSGLNQKSNSTAGNSQNAERTNRRSWSIEEKRRIAALSLKAGVSAKAVAKANGANPSQLYKWRRLYRSGLLRCDTAPALLPVTIAETSEKPRKERPSPTVRAETATGTICIELSSVRVFIEGKADADTLRAVLESLI